MARAPHVDSTNGLHKRADESVGGVVVRSIRALMALAVMTSVGEAQRPVGALREVRGLQGCAPVSSSLDPPNDAVRVSRSAGSFVEIAPGQSLNVLDQVQVKRLVDAKVFSSGGEGFGRGVIVFAPELGTCTSYGGEFQRRGRQLGGTRPGSYSIASRVERRGGRDTTRLVLALDYGGLVVDWQGGLMSIIALGREIQLTGTRVAVVVDSSATEAFVMVSEGSVLLTAFRGSPGRTIGRGRVARFNNTTPQVVETAIGEDLAANEAYHLESVFSNPVRGGGLSFARILGTAAVIGGVGYGGWLTYDKLIRKSNGNGFRTGTIVVRIPI